MSSPAVLDDWALADRVVIVTGASSGIGAATARALFAAGAHPVLVARRADRLVKLSSELGGALHVVADLCDASGVRRVVTETLARHGRIDALVNNAGVSFHHRLDTVDLDEFERVLAINVVAVVAMTQAVVPHLRAGGGGRIVNVSSGTTRMVPIGIGAYSAAKSAVNMLSAVARAELAGDGIVVSVVLPSVTAGEFGGGQYQLGAEPVPGLVVHSAEYAASYVMEALVTGAAMVDVPHGKPHDSSARAHAVE